MLKKAMQKKEKTERGKDKENNAFWAKKLAILRSKKRRANEQQYQTCDIVLFDDLMLPLKEASNPWVPKYEEFITVTNYLQTSRRYWLLHSTKDWELEDLKMITSYKKWSNEGNLKFVEEDILEDSTYILFQKITYTYQLIHLMNCWF